MEKDSSCIVCHSNLPHSDPEQGRLLCPECKKDPFCAEDARKALAKAGDLERLKQLYGEDTAYFPEGKIEKLWNRILVDQDDDHYEWNMTRTRLSLSLLKSSPPNCIDIACGQGYALRLLKTKNPQTDVYGIDLSKQRLDALAEMIDGHFAVASVESIPFGKKFKLALLLEVLEHVEVPRNRGFLKAIYELLEPDGLFLLSVPANDNLRQMMNHCPNCGTLTHSIGHIRSYTKELITAELKMAGFEVLSSIDIAGGSYLGIPRQKLMKFFPNKITPMVFALLCKKSAT